MKEYYKKNIFIIAFVIMLSLLQGCSYRGTSTGNPIVDLSFSGFTGFSKIGPLAVSSIQMCFKRIRFKIAGEPTATDPSTDEDNIDFNLGYVNISSTGTTLSSVELPVGTYARIEFDLDNSCASGKSLEVTNSSGTFSTNQVITIKFTGTLNHSEAGSTVPLLISQIVTALDLVTADTQIKIQAESTSGSF